MGAAAEQINELMKPDEIFTKPKFMVSLALLTSVWMIIFFSCKGDDPEPDPVTVPMGINSVADARNGISTINNADPKKNYVLNFGNFSADSGDIAGTLKDLQSAVNGKTNVKLNKNNSSTYPGSETGNKLKYSDYAGGIELGLTKSPTGLEYLAISAGDSTQFKQQKNITLNVYREFVPGEYGDHIPVVYNSSNLLSKLNEAKGLRAAGKKVALVGLSVVGYGDDEIKALEELLGDDDVMFDNNNVRIYAKTSTVTVTKPIGFMSAYGESINKSGYGDNHFSAAGKTFIDEAAKAGVSSQEAKRMFAEAVGINRTDTLFASSGNLERGMIPRTWSVDADLYDCSDISNDLSKYPKNIEIILLESSNPNVPGGKNRTLLLNGNIFSTPASEKEGEERRVMYFREDPVLDMYWEWNDNIDHRYIEVATGKRWCAKNPFPWTYDCAHGNHYVIKQIVSNRIVDKWAKERGKNELFPLTARNGSPLYGCKVKFPNLSKEYIWDVSETKNDRPLVSLATLHTIIKGAFKHYTQTYGNNHSGVEFSPVNPVFPDDIYNEVRSQPEPLGASMRAIDPSGRTQLYDGTVLSQGYIEGGSKKIWSYTPDLPASSAAPVNIITKAKSNGR